MRTDFGTRIGGRWPMRSLTRSSHAIAGCVQQSRRRGGHGVDLVSLYRFAYDLPLRYSKSTSWGRSHVTVIRRTVIRRVNIGATVPRLGAPAASQALDGTTPNPESKGTTMRRASAVLIVVTVLAASTIATAAAQNPQRFSDVPADHYAHEAVEWAATTGITGGCTTTTFCPDDPLTRAHVVTFLHRALAPELAASGIGHDTDPVVTDSVTLKPGYYTVRVQVARAPGFDWDNENDLRDFYAWFGSKAGGWDVLYAPDLDWLPYTEFFDARIDKTGDYWLTLELDDEFVWWADIYERPLPEGVSFG